MSEPKIVNPENDPVPLMQQDASHNSTADSSSMMKSGQEFDERSRNREEAGGGERGNLLAHYTEEDVMNLGRHFAEKYDLDPELFARAAALSRAPEDYQDMPFITDDEKQILYREIEHPYTSISPAVFWVIMASSISAVIQGMDESVINGASLFWPKAFGVVEGFKNYDLVQGLVNGAPYLCCSVSCWTTDLWNRHLGRKWTIFWTCGISFATCVWQGFVNNWWHLFLSRFFLGFGIGPKSATVPVYAAECTPAKIRGSLVMLWQFFTAVGIMLGYVMSLAFYYVPRHGIKSGINWRLMLGSACLPCIIVLSSMPWIPESPRWLLGKGRVHDAWDSMQRMRRCKISAARDLFYSYTLLKEEAQYDVPTPRRVKELFTVRRNRNATIGSWIVMFMQQFCGINVIAYYSSSIFILSGLSEVKAMLASWGFGMVNFVFAIPAFLVIDKLGRRNLLLITFPLMGAFLFVTGFGFLINDNNKHGRLAMVSVGIYFFTAVYSSGEGPVPFTYSAECFPLYVRDLGMSWATATCWFFNFILAFTWPRLLNAFGNVGAFMWYAGWNVAGFFMVLLFVIETKGLTLEELDDRFNVSMHTHAVYQFRNFWNSVQRHVFRKKIAKLPPLTYTNRNHISNQEWESKGIEIDHLEDTARFPGEKA
ncbi:hypothetical protein DIURU_003427 [Diutina rugosa]|uniref:Major facilitator superfamily (MFS) profile domain-containing protein n=1 Tax=Diutina rugosa TaxID=5481 RepID=A0A642UL38_DIURU|nr:uncharacterized protein DIURU_003427 [Diutina rugosa]KAA8901057.1 hypothetical protein DIURU_003427 [Diutina rugosa]